MSYNDAPAIGVSEQIREARLKTYPEIISLADFLADASTDI